MRISDDKVRKDFENYVRQAKALLRASGWSDSAFSSSVFLSILEAIVPENFVWEPTVVPGSPLPVPALTGYLPALELDVGVKSRNYAIEN